MDLIEEKIISNIEANKDAIIAIGRDIWNHAELGYKEFVTSKKFSTFCQERGMRVETDLAITGAKSYLKDSDDGKPTVAIIGELDALPMSDSPYACPETGASHACGHNAQMAAAMGAVFGLDDPEVKAALAGNVVFLATPAEEFIEMEFKQGLMREGKLGYGGGKSELIRIGAFDDVNIVLAHHIAPNTSVALSNHKSNGFLSKVIKFHGKASHAAEAPFDGIDALSAANLAMTAVNCQRESFREQDTVRIHGFISRGGEAMNIIADETSMEYSVRANNIPAILDADRKFDRSIRAAAIATGCEAEIITMPGYLPVIPQNDCSFLTAAIEDAAGQYPVRLTDPGECAAGSTDLGEVSHLMPMYQFNTGGYDGVLHGRTNHPVDEYLAYVVPAKVFALSAYKLLKDGAAAAQKIVSEYPVTMTKETFIEYMDSHNTVETVSGEL